VSTVRRAAVFPVDVPAEGARTGAVQQVAVQETVFATVDTALWDLRSLRLRELLRAA